jgi:hypothetical protein
LERDLGGGVPDLTEILLAKLDGGRADVLLKAIKLLGSRDWNDPRLLRKDPGESDW